MLCAPVPAPRKIFLKKGLTNRLFSCIIRFNKFTPLPNVLNQKSTIPISRPESCRLVRGSCDPDPKIPEEQPAERNRVSQDVGHTLSCRTFNRTGRRG